jgi:hypothetical protein
VSINPAIFDHFPIIGQAARRAECRLAAQLGDFAQTGDHGGPMSCLLNEKYIATLERMGEELDRRAEKIYSTDFNARSRFS